jgi:hypothetical protein
MLSGTLFFHVWKGWWSDRTMRPAAILVWAGLLTGCGNNLSPSSEQLAGAWNANSTLAAVTGEECLGGALINAIGSRDIFAAAINQSGKVLDALVTSHGNGTICAFTGTASGSAVTLNLTSCQAARIGPLRCGDGAVRELRLTSERISGSVSGGRGGGNDSSTWNVFIPGSAAPVAILSLSATFTWIALGLPSSDYHAMTGTVSPGYQDGTISIDAPEPFCLTCGWFGDLH